MSAEVKVDGERGPLTVHAVKSAATGTLKCYYCKRKMRPRGVKKSEAPGTMSMFTLTKCGSCYKKERDKRLKEEERTKEKALTLQRSTAKSTTSKHKVRRDKPLYLKPVEEVEDPEVRRNLINLKDFLEGRQRRETKRRSELRRRAFIKRTYGRTS